MKDVESEINIAKFIVKNFYYIKDSGKINIYESCKKLFKNICCPIRALTYIDLVQIIKG